MGVGRNRRFDLWFDHFAREVREYMSRNLQSFAVLRAATRSSWDETLRKSLILAPTAARSGFWDRWPRSAVTIAGAALLVATAAVAQNKIFNTSTGHRLELPPVSALETCAQIQDIMDRIDATNYRLGSPDSVKHPDDRKLLMYEDALSEQSYRKCQQRQPQGFLSGVRMKVE